MEEFDIDLNELCQHQASEELFVLPGSPSATSAQQICLQIDGDLNVVKSQEDLVKVSALNMTGLGCYSNAGFQSSNYNFTNKS